MSSFLAWVVLLVRIIAARPTEKASPAIPEDVKMFLLIQQNVWEENINLTTLSCEELRNQTSITLRVRNQNLTSFPECLPELLERLDLSVNLLPELNSQGVAYLPKLQILSLRQNQIHKMIWGTGNLRRLQFVDLSFNLLSVVPSCITSSLGNLRWLSLAGNPIREIQPFAFSCYPQLHFLNLSSTWLGKDGEMGIPGSAFAMNVSQHPSESTEEVRKAPINILDLSATYLEMIHEDWIKDLPQLTSFYLTQMPKLRRLDPAVFRNVPMLRELNCQDSHALSLVETESFHRMPHVASLIFENCNLSNFSPWNLTSSHILSINLYGNPLVCHCEISWLLSNPDTVILQRASDTVCYFSPEDKETSSSMLLSKLYDQCQAQTTTYSALSLVQGKPYHILTSITTERLADSSTLPQRSLGNSFIPQSTSFTWRELTRKGPSRTDVLAYKEQAVPRSTEHPLIAASLTTEISATPGKLSTEQPVVSTTEMKEREEDTTKPHQSSLPSFTTEVTGASSFEVSSDLFVPYRITDSSENDLSLLDPTKSTSLPNLASTHSLLDYTDDYDYEKQQVASVAQTVDLCDYDPCRHLQKPCVDLQKVSSCLCPGMSDEFTIPDPPRFHEVSEMRDTSAQIHWCSPNSAVRFYQLAYRPKGSEKNYTNSGEIYATARRYTLYNLLPGSTYQVCIIAWNKAGSSRTTGWNEYNPPCSTFVTKSSYTSIFAALCATSAVFLIATILLSVCLCKKHKTPHIEQYNTHLVSYKNPAFDYSIK